MGNALALLLLPSVIVLLVSGAVYAYFEYRHRQTTYYQSTKKSLLYLWTHVGDYGEYLIFDELKAFEQVGSKFLFNCYLPKKDGETTEIDLLMIDQKGIYVFESKNYGGWIFGDEKGKHWTQTFPRRGAKAKNQFLNPIYQNELHISCLKAFLSQPIPIYSVIVFSNRCVFRKLRISAHQNVVIHRSEVANKISDMRLRTKACLSNGQIREIYDALYPRTQVDDSVKKAHVDHIKVKHRIDADISNTTDVGKPNANISTISADHPNQPGILVPLGKINPHSLLPQDMPKGYQPESRLCPQCAAKMVLRTVKNGEQAGKQFYGCSAFPYCRYTEALNTTLRQSNKSD